MDDAATQIKGFWSRLEGKVGMVFAGGIVLGIGYLLVQYSALLLAAMANTAMAAVIGLALVALLTIVTSPQFWQVGSVIFKIAMYRLTNMLVAIDPIAVMKGHIAEARRVRDRIEGLLEEFSGHVEALRAAIAQNRSKIDMAMQMAGEAKRQLGNPERVKPGTDDARAKQKALILKARQAGRLEKSNKTYGDLLIMAERVLEQLRKYKDSADLLIEDKEDEIKEREMRHKISTSVMGVIRRIKRLKGVLVDNEIYDMALEAENQQFGEAIGTLRQFAESSADFVAQSDLANGVYAAEALARLEAAEAGLSGIDGIITKDGAGEQRTRVSGTTVRQSTGTGGGYGNLFN